MKQNTMKRPTDPETIRFSRRIRFNWGYHDAAQAVREHWDYAGHYWGFARTLGEKMKCPEDILRVHFDKHYANGWIRGYRDAKDGKYQNNSSAAWEAFTTENREETTA